MKKILRNIIAIILLLIGFISGFIPVLQGWIFVLAGYIILDFKKKEQFEEKIILFLEKKKHFKKLADLWRKAKKFNSSLVKDHQKDKIKDLFNEINKDIK